MAAMLKPRFKICKGIRPCVSACAALRCLDAVPARY